MAALCFVMLLVSGKFGGPLGAMKLLYCEYPFAAVTSTGLGEPESEYQKQLKLAAEKDASDKVTLLKVYSVLGALLYLCAVSLALYWIVRRHQDSFYLWLNIVLALVFLWIAISERGVPFQGRLSSEGSSLAISVGGL